MGLASKDIVMLEVLSTQDQYIGGGGLLRKCKILKQSVKREFLKTCVPLIYPPILHYDSPGEQSFTMLSRCLFPVINIIPFSYLSMENMLRKAALFSSIVLLTISLAFSEIL